ncbi:hypothetical protein P280DRAFT_176288 [Massarina eburnea CBS 473.64]|uniref:Chromodomain-helicase-DNA-binding protein 1-like C-terminal domain-containing protein n=1 Tax=Massarina eburnea CBS 473.64 TaxID=1395130 RepID=A0A6A6SD58_9PLEO|nr:hypothetical protein P280DRAFT_176288 [Massarina eburnea CBS 473.64]
MELEPVPMSAPPSVILQPVQAHLEKLKQTTIANMPPQNNYIKSKTHIQLVRERLLRIGDFIVEWLRTVPEPERGFQEIRLCKYIAGNYWPLRSITTSPGADEGSYSGPNPEGGDMPWVEKRPTLEMEVVKPERSESQDRRKRVKIDQEAEEPDHLRIQEMYRNAQYKRLVRSNALKPAITFDPPVPPQDPKDPKTPEVPGMEDDREHEDPSPNPSPNVTSYTNIIEMNKLKTHHLFTYVCNKARGMKQGARGKVTGIVDSNIEDNCIKGG